MLLPLEAEIDVLENSFLRRHLHEERSETRNAIQNANEDRKERRTNRAQSHSAILCLRELVGAACHKIDPGPKDQIDAGQT